MSTSADSTRPNYPPSAWLEQEGWTIPVVIDDANQSVLQAFGLSAFPLSVFINADGTVAGRITGGIPVEDFISIAEQFAE